MPPGGVYDHHRDMARRCLTDVDDVKHQIAAAGATVEHQADAMRRHDMTIAHRIIDRHVIMHGVGIPAENLTRIFSHGFTTRRQGHGFGLHSSALAVRDLGGSIQAQSDGTGKGATFTLLLPTKSPSETGTPV